MSDDLFETAPPPPSGLPFWKPAKFFNQETERGQLLLFEITHVAKAPKYKSDPPVDVDYIYGTVHALTGPKAGESFSLATSSAKLVAQLKGKSGKRVLGRLAQQDTGKGNPAWVLETEVSEEDRALAVDFLKNGPSAVSNDPPF